MISRRCSGSSSIHGTSSGMLACLAKRFSSLKSVRYFGLVQGSIAPSVQRFRFVGNDQVEIEVDGVAESLAARASAVRIVEREQPRLGLLVAHVAGLAFEALGETQALRWLVVARGRLEDDLAGLAIADFDASTMRARASSETTRRSTSKYTGWVKLTSSSDSGVENSKIWPLWYRRLKPRWRSSNSRVRS